MKTDILQNKINADIRKKKELEKQLEERKAARDFLIKDMESQTMLSRGMLSLFLKYSLFSC